MKISKHDALVLAKVLTRVVDPSQPDDEKSQLDVDLEDLAERVDAYLTGDDCDDHCEDHKDAYEEEDDEDEEADDDCAEAEDLDGEEDEEEEEEDLDLGEEEDEDDEDGDEELEADRYVAPERLHDLKSVKSDGVTVEFEDADDDTDSVVVIEDGFTELTISHLRRKGKELHVRSTDGDWYVYAVERFPAGWATVLPLNLLVEIER